MNSPLPVLSTADPIAALGAALVGFLVAKDILSENGVPAQLQKAQNLVNFTNALEEIEANQPAGVADLQTAIANLVATVKDPALAPVLNQVLASVSTQLAALESTVIGKLASLPINEIVKQINNVAAWYVTKLSQGHA